MRNAAIVGLVLIAALLPLIALPVAIVSVEPALILVAAVVLISAYDVQAAALRALPLFRAPPSL